jgi:RNA polymerase sigma-70 factor (ECF subfamily)
MTEDVQNPWHVRVGDESPGLVGFLTMLTGRRDLAEDVAHDAVLEAWRVRDRFRETEDFGRWLRGIARNLLRRRFAEKNRLVVPFSDAVVDRLEIAWARLRRDDDDSERVDALRLCLDALDPAERRRLTERYGNDRSIDEIAAMSGRTTDAVKMLFMRLRRRLQECVERRLGGRKDDA